MLSAAYSSVSLALALLTVTFLPDLADLVDHVVVYALILAVAATVHWIDQSL